MRGMISRSMMPLAFLTAGPLANNIFEPLMDIGGAWGNSLPTQLIGAGAGLGIGLLFVLSGILLVVASVLAFANPCIRLVESELPDVIEVASAGDAPVLDPVALPAD